MPPERPARRISTPALVALAASLGTVAGLGAYAFADAGGLDDLSGDPAACIACHPMRAAHDAWRAGPHRTVPCRECHGAAGGFARMTHLAHGAAHAWAFLHGGGDRPRLDAATAIAVQANCVRCHEGALERMDLGRPCFECHAETRHER